MSPLLTHKTNLYFLTGCFLNSLKKYLVVPINKSEQETDVKSYRLISILDTLSKTSVRKYIVSYSATFTISNGSVQISLVSGKFSTSNAIIDILQYIYDSFYSGKSVISVFLDFVKAFHSVDHENLLPKSSMYVVRSNDLK